MTLLTTSQIIKKYDLGAKKSLGQNFILDKNFTDKIVSLAGDLSGAEVLEIGPGPGSLTRSILDAGPKKLIAIERDERCIKALSELTDFYQEKLEIINGDAVKINEEEIFTSPDKIKIIANLPYNIGTILLLKWLKLPHKISSMHLMLQKEVVDRITAKKGEEAYGRLSILVNLLCQTKMALKVNKTVFTPQPKVTSAIVEIIPREKPLFEVDLKNLEKVTATAFNQRRKMLKSSLKPIFQNSEEILKGLNINPELRAETLEIEDFCRIANAISAK